MMNLSLWLVSFLVLPSAACASAWTPASSTITDGLAAESLNNLLHLVGNGTLKSFLATQNVSQTCTEENVVRRKDYTTLSQEEKLDYVNAMKCLMDAPAITPVVSTHTFAAGIITGKKFEETLTSRQELIPGVRSRYDDFVGTHVNQTG